MTPDLRRRFGSPVRVAGSSDAQAQADALKARAQDLQQRVAAAGSDPAKLAALKQEAEQLADEAAQLAPQLQEQGLPFLPFSLPDIHFPDFTPEIPSALWWGLAGFGLLTVGGVGLALWTSYQGAKVAYKAAPYLGPVLAPELAPVWAGLGAFQQAGQAPGGQQAPTAQAPDLLGQLTQFLGAQQAARAVAGGV